jgi:hypothetical protein
MAPVTQVKLSQWLITVVAVFVGTVSGYRLLQYKVAELETEVDSLTTKTTEIQTNKESVIGTQHSVELLAQSFNTYAKRNQEQHTEIKITMRKNHTEVKDAIKDLKN